VNELVTVGHAKR